MVGNPEAMRVAERFTRAIASLDVDAVGSSRTSSCGDQPLKWNREQKFKFELVGTWDSNR